MASLWKESEGFNKHEMSSYGGRIRYLYSKMCCLGEWRDLHFCGLCREELHFMDIY